MANLIMGGNTYAPAVYPREMFSVWVKREWADSWLRVPYMIPINWSETAAPSNGQASLRWEYGAYVNRWYHSGGSLLPLDLENWIVKIQVHTIYGTYIGFLGVFIAEHMKEEGVNSVTGLPTGYQVFECRDLKYLLERRRVLGTFVGDGDAWVYLKRTRHFNLGYSQREGKILNRSNTYNDAAGCYMFEEGGSNWSNYDIIEYLLACFQPWYPTGDAPGGASSLSPLFYIIGQVDPLRYLYGEYRLWGKSISDCLNILIDRRRGFGWHLVTDGDGPIYLRVYSLSENELWGADSYIPANPSQLFVPVSETHHIAASYHITSMRQIDEIIVESDQPVKCMATLGYDNNSLEEGFTTDQMDDYDAATDDARASDLYSAAYTRHQVPTAFDFSDWIPSVNDYAEVDVEGVGTWWNFDLSFERYLPIEEDSTAGETEYIEPFALIAKPNRTWNLAIQLVEGAAAPYDLAAAQAATNPEITETEFAAISLNGTSITATDILDALADNPNVYIHLDRTQNFDYPNCSMRLGDGGLSFYVRSQANHVFGVNDFLGNSDVEAVFDYRTLLATMFFRTDEMLRVRLPVWNGSYTDSNGNTVTESNPQGKQIHIVIPGQECWVVAPDTVTSVDDEGLVFWNDGTPGILRDDSARLRWAALVAYVWYGQQRAAAEFTIANNLPWFRIGDLVKATFSGFWWERIGTVVTSITHDCESGTQVVRTAYGEMDPVVVTDDGGAK